MYVVEWTISSRKRETGGGLVRHVIPCGGAMRRLFLLAVMVGVAVGAKEDPSECEGTLLRRAGVPRGALGCWDSH